MRFNFPVSRSLSSNAPLHPCIHTYIHTYQPPHIISFIPLKALALYNRTKQVKNKTRRKSQSWPVLDLLLGCLTRIFFQSHNPIQHNGLPTTIFIDSKVRNPKTLESHRLWSGLCAFPIFLSLFLWPGCSAFNLMKALLNDGVQVEFFRMGVHVREDVVMRVWFVRFEQRVKDANLGPDRGWVRGYPLNVGFRFFESCFGG